MEPTIFLFGNYKKYKTEPFWNANLKNSDLRGSKLFAANFTHTDLSFADISDTNLYRLDFSLANLTGANLSDSDLSKSFLKHSILNNANLKNTNLHKAELSHAQLEKANLTNANLTQADLLHANFLGANLSGASVLLTYSKDTNYENVIITQDTKTDSCFSRGLVDRVICYFYRTITPESPPFYGYFQKIPTGFQFEN